MEQKPGFRFHPTDEELINHYLTNKNVGQTWLVDDVINEINIYHHDPESLPLLSRIKSKDPVYYFFTRTEYKSAKRNSRKRSTKSGYWKPTGKVKKIKDKRGKMREIGEKRVLVYHLGKVHNGVKTPWVMHEYQMLHHDPDSYVICKIFDNAEEEEKEEEDISNGINSSEPSQSLVSDLSTFRPMSTLPEVEQQIEELFDGLPVNYLSPCDGFNQNTLFSDNNNNNSQLRIPYLDQEDDEFLGGLKHVNREEIEYLFSDQELVMQENHNDYRPKKSLSGIIVDYSSVSDSESATLEYTLPKVAKIYKLMQNLPSGKLELTRREIQEVKEKRGWFIAEEAMERNRKNPQYIYLMNMIIGFTLLVALIGDIISNLNLPNKVCCREANQID